MSECSKKGTKAKGGHEPRTLHRVALRPAAGACSVAGGWGPPFEGCESLQCPAFQRWCRMCLFPVPVFKLFKQLRIHDPQKPERERSSSAYNKHSLKA